MLKRLLICFSLLFGLCMSMQAYSTERVQKQRTGSEGTTRVGRRLPAIQTGRDRSDAGNTIAQGLILSEETAFLKPSKAQAIEIPTIPEGTITTNNIYGDKIYPSGSGSKGRGLKIVRLDGSLSNVMLSDIRVYYKCFGIKENMLYAFMWQKDDYGEICRAWFRSLNLWTDEYTDVDMEDTFEDTFIQSGVYVPEENAFYGFGYQCWLKFDVATMKTTKLASPAAGTFNPQMTYNTKLRKIVGITSEGALYSYSKEDGAQTLLHETGVTSPYTAGLCYDAMSNYYIWNPNTDSTSRLIAFNAETYEAYKICDVEDLAQISVMYCNESKKKDPEAPRIPEYVTSSFKNGAYTGTIEFKLPSLCNNDTQIESAMDYKLFIDGIEYAPASGSGNAGQNVVLNIGEDAHLEDGVVGFNLVCSLGSHESLDNNVGVYVGNDIPLKPKNVKLTKEEITWDPVVAGEHDAYLDPNGVIYNVELNGTLVAEGISETSCATGISDDAELESYTATVYAIFKGHVSEGGTSNDIQCGHAFSEPAYFQPTKSQSKLFVVDDANDDWSTWRYHEGSGAFRHAFDWTNDADDWLFLPPVNITDTEHLHTFSMNAWAVDEEVFEVYVGREPSADAMTQLVIAESSTPGGEVKTAYEGMFNVVEPGSYYIGIHAITPADRLYLYARDMRVEVSPVSKNGPDVVQDVTATPAAEGGLSATITFRMPVATINGDQLSGTVTAVVSSESDSKTVSGEPGSSHTVELITVQGNNHFTIQTLQGEIHGMMVESEVYTGLDLPGVPQNLKAVLNEDNLSGTLYWNAPSEGQNGNYISQTDITYYLCQKAYTLFGTYEWEIVSEIGTDVFEFKFSVEEDTPQQNMSVGVIASNIAGVGNQLATVDFTIGVPYELPAAEMFQGANPAYGPVFLTSKGESKVNWSISDPATQGEQYATADGAAIVGTTATDTYGCIALPKFSTLGMQKAGFMPTFYFGGCENIKITATASGVEETEILDMNTSGLDNSEGYRQIEVKLPEKFQNRGWVAINVYPYFSPEHSMFVMDGYRMKNLIDQDLSVQVADRIRGSVGEKMTFKATVTNIGIADCTFTGGKFTLTDSRGNLIAEKSVEAQTGIAVDESKDVTWDYVPATKDMGECIIKFELAGKDMNSANDSHEAECEIIKGKTVLIEDLTAKMRDGQVSLKWTEPEVRNGSESFEDYVPFIESGSMIGEFTHIYDANVEAYGMRGTSEANKKLKDVMYKTGFHVYNSDVMNSLFGRGAVPYASDGEQLLIAFCPGKQSDGNIPSANDWLITPPVKGGTVFSLSACPIINSYGMEQLEIRYSTEDTVDPSEFELLELVEIGDSDTEQTVTWQEISVTLPENVKRVALHYISRDIFGICIDDVHYTPEAGDVSVTGYEIYRAEESKSEFSKLGEGSDCTYSDKSATEGNTYSYYVLPLLSDGTHGAESNIATVKVSGVNGMDVSRFIAGGTNEIIVRGYDGLTADVYTVDGIVIANTKCSEVTRISVMPGIYIVNIDGNVAKISVR